MTKIISAFMFLLFSGSTFSQNGNLPVKEWGNAAESPLIFYISGDGGFNYFSSGLCNSINRAGYSVTALNARNYFWEKKEPETAAIDIAAYLEKKFLNRKNQQLVLAGYSFGADVLPFIVNKLPEIIKMKLKCVLLLTPSTTTDLEIHWSDLFGSNNKRSKDVVAEINRMGIIKTAIISGSSENDFPLKSIKLVNYQNEKLPGGHHYEGDIDKTAKTIIKYIN